MHRKAEEEADTAVVSATTTTQRGAAWAPRRRRSPLLHDTRGCPPKPRLPRRTRRRPTESDRPRRALAPARRPPACRPDAAPTPHAFRAHIPPGSVEGRAWQEGADDPPRLSTADSGIHGSSEST